MANFAIRPVGTADLVDVVALFRAYAAGLPVDLSAQDFDAEIANLPGQYAPPGGRLLLARAGNGQASGCVAFRRLSGSACEVKRLYVAPYARRTGLGKALIHAAIAEARGAGYRELKLDTLGEMQSAIALYRTLGFMPIAPYGSHPYPGLVCLGLTLAPDTATNQGRHMAKATRATRMLEKSSIVFTVHDYEFDAEAQRAGMQAAAALGENPQRVLKTLMVLVDGKPVCAIVPSDREVSMKKLAAAVGGKSARMMKPADAERLTGYKVGGISPFGQTHRVPTVIEESALEHTYVFINAGQRGLQVKLYPHDALTALGAKAAPLAA